MQPPEALAKLLNDGGYLPRGVPLLKRVAGLPGQTICRLGFAVTVDGVPFGDALSHHRRGRPLPVWQGCVTLGEYQMFVMNFNCPTRAFLSATLLVAITSQALSQSPPHDATAQPKRANAVAAAVAEASRRFGIPETWIRAVIRAESNGDAWIVSPSGAIGLMQLMPKTYAKLRPQLRKGPDPFAIRDNILAGTVYLRQLHDRYGIAGMVGAYNAGPRRWEQHLAGIRRLPRETVGYITKLAPKLGFGRGESVDSAAPSNIYSSFQSPLFFALANAQTSSRPPADRQRMLAIIDANTMIVPPLGDLFAHGSNAKEPPPTLNQSMHHLPSRWRGRMRKMQELRFPLGQSTRCLC